MNATAENLNAARERLAEPFPVRMFTHPDNKYLAKVLTGIVLAMSKDYSRAHINSLLVEVDSLGRAIFVATDGHRLHLANLGVHEPGEPVKFNMEADGAKALINVLKGTPKGSHVKFSATAKELTVAVGGTVSTYPVNADTFPPYEKIIPKDRARYERRNVVGAQPRYMVHAFRACDALDGALVIDMGAELDPIKISTECDGDRIECVIMPMRLDRP